MHAKPRQKLGEYYTSFDTQHARNSYIYGNTRLDLVINQVLNVKKVQKERKHLQFVTMFHLLIQSKPLIDYKCMQEFFSFLKVERMLKMHQVDSNKWGMVGMYSFPLYISCKYQNSSSSFWILFGNLIRIYHFFFENQFVGGEW